MAGTLLSVLAALVLVATPLPAMAQDAPPPVDGVAAAVRAAVGGKLRNFYRPRGYWPLWVEGSTLGPQADRLVDLVSTAELDGLDPKDYDPDELRAMVETARNGAPEALAAAELRLSRVFAEYVRDVRRAPTLKITYLDKELIPDKETDAEILRVAALAPSFGDYMKTGGWMSPIYGGLREALGRYRKDWAALPAVDIPPGATIKARSKGDRVRLLRRRLGLPESAVFDKALGAKLRAFQADHGLPVDAVAGSGTLAALNRGPDHYERLIALNLERARLLPGPWTRHIVVDASAARLWLYRDGREEGTMRVIVGKPTEQTPMLAGMMRYAILNPYWNVPTDLVQRRVAPKMLAGATLASFNYEALSDWSANPARLDPASIDWHAVADGSTTLRIRQLPGGANQMGKMKFMFPNDLGIYLHDTPDKGLFAEKARQFSSGCVRLEDAPRLAKWLFGTMPELSSDDPEQQLPLPQPVPVYLTYLTAMPTESGGVAFAKDVYGRDETSLERMAGR